MTKKLKIVISGSFSRNFEGIKETIKEFKQLGLDVLSPKDSKVLDTVNDFVFLDSDKSTDIKVLEQAHLDAITSADALYIYNSEDYLGDSSKMELGWALALGKPIFCKEKPKDSTIQLFCGQIATPEETKNILENRSPLDSINERSSVAELQKYIHEMVIRRGFDEESPRDAMLMMVEEVGEMAKAMRKYIGLKTDQEKQDRYTKLEHELADVFIYLLDIANLLNVSLFKALHEKEKENETRNWN